MLVTKADGTMEEFRPEKLKTSLKKAGAKRAEIDTIVRNIEKTLTDGVTTQVIYRRAFTLLRKSEQPIAAKYSLRRALFSLGPTGFPFEDFLARLFEVEGYTTKRRILIQGKCATHEIDIAAYKPDHSFVAEAKFHSRPGIKSDLQVALYSYARYLDLKSHPICREDVCGIDDLYIITNTKFTHAAVRYTECVGIKLLSWNYPKGNTLQHRIESAGLYPITTLSSLSNTQKATLLELGVILCRDLLKKPDMLKYVGITHIKAEKALEEAKKLCKKE